jgi:hypothetical protein
MVTDKLELRDQRRRLSTDVMTSIRFMAPLLAVLIHEREFEAGEHSIRH